MYFFRVLIVLRERNNVNFESHQKLYARILRRKYSRISIWTESLAFVC